jgi:hypothetical protein
VNSASVLSRLPEGLASPCEPTPFWNPTKRFPSKLTMSSGWVSDSVFAVPLPFGWKLCFSVVAWTIWLTLSGLLEAPVLVLTGEALAAELELELELEVEAESEHPAVPSRLTAATVTPSEVAVRRVKIFMRRVVPVPGDT